MTTLKEQKSYILGYIYTDISHIETKNAYIQINFDWSNRELFQQFSDVCKKAQINFQTDEKRIIRINQLNPITVSPRDKHFLRGYFDRNGKFEWNNGYPLCTIPPHNKINLQNIINAHSTLEQELQILRWEGPSALDFMYELYKNPLDIHLESNRSVLLSLSINTPPGFLNSKSHKIPTFRWARTLPEAQPPQKSRFSDTGWDLHLVKKSKIRGNVHYYDTGIQIQPQNGYYFDLVGRSSISKSGWMLANNVGIIDSSYRGSILVALVRIDPQAPDLELPNRLVQLIPRKLITMEALEVPTLSKTQRQDGGFGSTGN